MLICVEVTGTDLLNKDHDSCTIRIMQIDESEGEGTDMLQLDILGKDDVGEVERGKIALTFDDAEHFRNALDLFMHSIP